MLFPAKGVLKRGEWRTTNYGGVPIHTFKRVHLETGVLGRYIGYYLQSSTYQATSGAGSRNLSLLLLLLILKSILGGPFEGKSTTDDDAFLDSSRGRPNVGAKAK